MSRECDPVPESQSISAPLQEMSSTIFSTANCKKSFHRNSLHVHQRAEYYSTNLVPKACSAEADEPKANSQTAMRQTRNTNQAIPKTARLLFEGDQHHSLQRLGQTFKNLS